MTHLFAEFRHRLASGSRTPALLCFLGLSCLGLEAVGFVFHREGEILPLVLVILLSAIPFAIAVFYVAKSKRFPHGSLTVILLFGVLMRIGLVPLDPPYLSTAISGMGEFRRRVSVLTTMSRPTQIFSIFAILTFIPALTARNTRTPSIRQSHNSRSSRSPASANRFR